jgi:general secretion pathway protein A
MYQTFYRLAERPFELTPNPRYLYLTPQHREALSNLEYGIVGRKGITVLLGEAGTGKTTLIRAAINGRSPDARLVVINNPTLTRAEFVQLVAGGFGLTQNAFGSKAAFLVELDAHLRGRSRLELPTALVVDEAQSLPDELLEEIRLLANMETDEDKLLPVVLAGQPELADRLNSPSLRQLKQRVALRCSLGPLTLQETAAYIATRIRIAGGECARIFTREAVTLIHQRSQGIPRTVSVICDNALVTGFALGEQPVSRRIIEEVCRDFDLADSTAAAASTGAGELSVEPAAQPPPAEKLEKSTETSTAAPPLPAPVGDRLFAGVGQRRRFSFF